MSAEANKTGNGVFLNVVVSAGHSNISRAIVLTHFLVQESVTCTQINMIIDLILGGYFRHIPNCHDVRFKRATQNWFP